MTRKLTDRIVKALSLPKAGNRIAYDSEVSGFGCRVTHGGSRAFILNYRTRVGRERRYTLGAWPDWSTVGARKEAKELKQRIDRGEDPLAEIEKGRGAKTVADLCERFLKEHCARKNRATTTRDYTSIINRWILPKLKHRKAAEVTFADVDDLHAYVSKDAPYVANRMLAILSKAFNLAVRWQWVLVNPVRGVERNQEVKRQRYLSTDELLALGKTLAAYRNTQAANVVRLLLLTGARSGEVLNAQWEQFDIEAGVWIKPAATTKQKLEHRVPLSAPARQLLQAILAAERAKAKKRNRELSAYVFPSSRVAGEPRENMRRAWAEICKATRFKSPVRIHDLRHTYASILASSGRSLPIIGALLGHTQAATTQRYAHLFDDPLRAAAEHVGAIVGNGNHAEVIPIKGKR
jgi:integrase